MDGNILLKKELCNGPLRNTKGKTVCKCINVYRIGMEMGIVIEMRNDNKAD